MELLARKDVPVEEIWDLSLIYADEALMWEELHRTQEAVAALAEAYQGKLTSAAAILGCLRDQAPILEAIDRIWSYSDLALEADYTDNALRERDDKVRAEITRMSEALSFVESEILLAPEAELEAAQEQAQAQGCSTYLRNLIARKPHMLHPETERVLAALAQALDVPYTVYNTMKLADIAFPSFTVDGTEYPLGYSLFEDEYELEADTAIRRAAFRGFYDTLAKYQNTCAAAYNAQVTCEKTMADLRGFSSVFDSLLFEQQVTAEMHDRQVDLITELLAPHMRRYARLLQAKHGLEHMTFADLKIALDPEYDPRVTIAESHEIIRNAVALLGPDYQAMVDRAYAERWIDFARNIGKSTGGFCAEVYRKRSYILLNWNNRMADVFTLAHELGHAGQNLLSDAVQSIYEHEPSVYLVEAPSTMNELLLGNYLLAHAPEDIEPDTREDARFRRWVLSSMVSNTYYHNFVTHLREAWYQREVYRIIDAGGSVNAEVLNDLFRRNLELFWGDAVEITSGAELTWMRQPHYYGGLYPYTYSASLTVSTQAMLRMRDEGVFAGQRGESGESGESGEGSEAGAGAGAPEAPAVADWKRLLASGGSLDPVAQAALAGVDITTDKPLRATIAYIGSLIDEICALTEELDGIRVE